MLTDAEAYGPYAAQTRRFALRCERAPILADGNLVLLPFGTCKRCEKAGAECRTTTTGISVANANNDDRTVKRKSPPVEVKDDNSDPSSHSGSLHSTIDNDLDMFSHTPFSHEPFGHSPGGSLIFNTDGGGMLDLGPLETEVGDFHTLDSMKSPTSPSIHLQYLGSAMGQTRSHEGISASIDTVYEAPTVSTSGSTNKSDGPTATVPLVDPQSNPRDDQDERKRLLDLHTLVFDGLYHIGDSDLANSLLNATTLASRSRDTRPSDIVGRVLVTSERLIELLDIFEGKLSSDFAPRPRENSVGKRRLSSLAPTRYQNASPSQPTNNILRRQLHSLPTSFADRRVECEKLMACSMSSSIVSLPVALSFLTCYVGLLSAYRTIFSHIQEMLRAAETPLSAPTGRSIPQSKRALLSLAEGNTLNHEQILRIRIQLEVMTHMLDRIPRAWAGIINDSPRRNEDDIDDQDGPYNKAAAMSLLKGMLIHEGFDCKGGSSEIGLSSLDAILETIRRMLRGERSLC
ncbi:hypothetical protein F4680DRAFT_449525 [Xylaria scruposa]|nr:hypothetical protein F4680DRAFT_449525 [Xylaria scruposa]